MSDRSSCRFIHCGRLHARRSAMFRAHAHPCHELIVPLRGALRVRIAGMSATAEPGAILWYPAGAEHLETVGADRDADWRYLLIDTPGRRLDLPLLSEDRDGAVRQLAGLIAADAGHGAASAAKRDALAAAAIAELERLRAGDVRSDDGMVAAADEFIERRIAEPLSVERLARAAGASRAHFARVYRARTGRTPMAAVRTARLAAARELLLSTDLPLRVIAPRVGIGSEYLLSRLLARHHGVGARGLRLGRRRIGLT